ncbi:ATP-binding cassette domain-containing protein [Sinomicrobium sp. M5D2P17]
MEVNTLQIDMLSKSFGKKQILSDIGFTCSTGEIIGVFGRNGAGKSTLLKIIYGTLKADRICIKVNSNSVKARNIIPSKKIAYLPQNTFLPKELKVRDIIPFFFPEGEQQDRLFYSPLVVRFENLRVGKLSLGQLRYLEVLLIANLKHPFVMLDEPFSMIEPIYKDAIKEMLVALKQTKGIILTDHYYKDVLQVSNRNFLLKEGKKIEVNDIHDLAGNEYLKR